MIPYVDHLFAKSGRYLEEYCLSKEISHHPFRNFSDVLEAMNQFEAESLLSQE